MWVTVLVNFYVDDFEVVVLNVGCSGVYLGCCLSWLGICLGYLVGLG